MKNKVWFIVILKTVIVCFLILLTIINNPLKETIQWYPIDENISFSDVSTNLKFNCKKDEDEYSIKWSTASKLDENTTMRIDLSLLFEDGILRDILFNSKQNSAALKKQTHVYGEDSGFYQTISFHYGEIEYADSTKKSIQNMSYDELYVLDSPLSPNQAFKIPTTNSQKEGKQILDTIINQNLYYTWEELITFFNIPQSRYYALPLTNLAIYNNKGLHQLTTEETQALIQLVWDSIYHDYFLELKKYDGELMSPVGSTIPLILFHQSFSHFIILFECTDGTKYQVLKHTELIELK